MSDFTRRGFLASLLAGALTACCPTGRRMPLAMESKTRKCLLDDDFNDPVWVKHLGPGKVAFAQLEPNGGRRVLARDVLVTREGAWL